MQCLHPIFVQVQVLALASARSVSPAASYLKIGMPHHPQVTKCPGSWFGPSFLGFLNAGVAVVCRAEILEMNTHPCGRSWSRATAAIAVGQMLICN